MMNPQPDVTALSSPALAHKHAAQCSLSMQRDEDRTLTAATNLRPTPAVTAPAGQALTHKHAARRSSSKHRHEDRTLIAMTNLRATPAVTARASRALTHKQSAQRTLSMNTRAVWATVLMLTLAVALVAPAMAHKQSDSYLTLTPGERAETLNGQWDIALRDLDHAIGLDANADGLLTWGEVKARQAAIDAYAFSRLTIATGEQNKLPCHTTPTQLLVDEHVDGRYAVLRFTTDCPAPATQLHVTYSLLFDVDPNHRGLLHLRARSDNAANNVNASSNDALTTTAPANTATLFSPDNREATLTPASPNRLQQFVTFANQGVWHIWEGYDHLLFLLVLLLPSVLIWRNGRWESRSSLREALWDISKVVTAFTLAHSITLALASYEILRWPSRIVESLIAFTVLLGALNILFPIVRERRWLVALGFGLIHGLGFAAVLADMELSSSTLLIGLLGFNAGVELGQLACVLIFVPVAYVLRTQWIYRRALMPAGATAICALACYWLAARALDFSFG